MTGSLGMFAHPGIASPRSVGPVSFGLHSAVRSLFRALLDRGASPLNLYATPLAYGDVDAEVREAARTRPPDRPAIYMRSVADALDRFDAQGVGAWLDLAADVRRPVRLRQLRSNHYYPVVVVEHTFCYQHFLHDWFLRLLLGDWQACDAVVCPSRWTAQAFTRCLEQVASRVPGGLRFGGRVEVVPMGVDPDAFRPLDRGACRERLGWRQGETVVLWVGRVSARDKADLLPLVKVVSELQRERPDRDLRLVVAGSARPDEDAELVRAVPVYGMAGRFTAVQLEPDDPRRAAVYSAADVACFPADNVQETFGLAPLEAMACGLPVVASDWDGYKEVVADGETGFLVPTAMHERDDDASDLAELCPADGEDLLVHSQSVAVDYDVLKQKLALLCDDEELRKRLGAGARERAELMTWERTVRGYEAVVEAGVEAAQARLSSLDPRESARGAHERPDRGQAFRSYPTTVVDDDAVVAVTPCGEAALAVGKLTHARRLLYESSLLEVLSKLRLGPASVKWVVKQLDDGRPDATRRHVMWLVKHGYARLVK